MHSIEHFMFDLPKHEQEICFCLREIVLQSAPDFDEQFSYGVPYYFRNRSVCCLWPASAKGGPKRGVFLGFCQGNLLSNEQGIIEMGNRKRFGLIRFFDVKEINQALIYEILQEAILVDDGLRKLKRRN
ncbi:MAG: DUF1801 domain-containing protein [Chitinophagales bacterium]